MKTETHMTKTTRKYKITAQRVLAAVEADDNRGFCLACGAEAYGVEPDMRKGECEECGEHRVYGAEEVMIMAGIGV